MSQIKKLNCTDITTYDAEKCFDKLCAKEFFNNMFDNGFKSATIVSRKCNC